ncbi:MAG: histidine phosphatase family protein [Granulosicoccaceae bacterium]
MNIHLFRHGQIEGPAALYGKSDVPLSEQGFASLSRAVIDVPAADLIISSPLQRCLAFALSTATQNKCPLVTDANLREMDFGDWDGEPYREDDPSWEQKRRFWRSPANNTPPNGEALQDMYSRVTEAWATLITRPEHTVWVFTHGGVIRLILAELLGLDWRNPALYATLQIAYASRTDITIGRHKGTLTAQLNTVAAPAPNF